MSYKMTDNDVCCVTLERDTRLMVLNCQAHFENLVAERMFNTLNQ